MLSQLKNIDFERFFKALEHILGRLECLAILDEDCHPIYSFGNKSVIAKLDAQELKASLSVSEKTEIACGGSVVAAFPQSLADGRLVSFVYARAKIPTEQDAQRFTEYFSELVAGVSSEITYELSLHIELDDMAEELGRRYEELNLVYSVKDHAELSSGVLGAGNRSLQQLVDDCATFLNVDYAVISIPGNNLLISSVESIAGAAQPLTSRQLYQCYDLVAALEKAVVLNSDADAKTHCIEIPDGTKLVCVPIAADNNRLAGVFVVVKYDVDHEFSNSDRQLVEIQAEMSRKIIQSRYDPLTGMLNRAEFEGRFSNLLNQESSSCLLLVFYFNNYKIIVENFGYALSNHLLRSFADILLAQFSVDHLIGRVDSNEFAVVLRGDDANNFQVMLDQLLANIDLAAKNRQLIPEDCGFSVNVGIVSKEDGLEDAADWLVAGDIACVLAKDNSFQRQHRYNPEDEKLTQHKSEMLWLRKVKAAIGQQSFLLYCQPMASLSGGPPHYEILLRIVDETGEPLSPAKFIDAAERYDLMPSIDEWVVKSSLEMLERHDISSVSPDSIWSINLSGQSLSSEKFKKFLLTTLSSVNLDNRQVCFEVTETAAIGQFDKAMALISAVKGVGASFSLDDFGSGLSSFSYLKEIPVEYLKIDGSFVKDIESNNVNFSMVKAMNSVGKLMGLTTIAEFVSSQQSMDMLESIGIDYAQGYFISEPLLLTAVLNELAQESARQCVKS